MEIGVSMATTYQSQRARQPQNAGISNRSGQLTPPLQPCSLTQDWSDDASLLDFVFHSAANCSVMPLGRLRLNMNQETGQVELIKALHGCSSWQGIQAKWRNYSEKQKGDLFEELVKAYLQLEPEYASKLKHVWLQREVPQAIARKLKLPATDQGIDIVAETHDGGFWAIQCKYRQETDHSLTWRDISTFTGLAFGVCHGFSFGVICSTTERITHVLKDQERIGFCALDVWQALDADFLKRLRAHLSRKPGALKPLRPRPHQKPALKDAHEHFVIQKAKRGKLIMPCGSGKSLTAYWIAGELGARSIVIAVPSLALIRQTLKVWLRETQANQQEVDWICVCSDESAGRVERDDSAVLRQDLGVPCLTNPKEIAAWLKRKHRGLTVVFTTYQSGEALAKAARAAKFTFDLGIMDEAHKTVGDGEKLFSHLLHDKNLPIRRRLFMTATERRYKGQSDTVLSMDDPATYGETFHLLSFKRAMEYDPPILSDYKIISIAVSREEVAELIRKNTFVRPDKGPWDDEIEADMLASLIALRKAMKKYPIRHAVSFHGSIQRAELFKTHNDAFSKSFRTYGKLETFHVSGKTATGTRARIIGEFARAERALITNARCLTEGVDVPGIDCVLFADPRRSAVDIVQAVGRALRPAPGKQFGYVIVPILHDSDATADDIFKSPAFKEVLTTLRALAANDDRIIEYFRGVSKGQQRKGGGSVQFDLDERLAKRINLADFAHEIELKCWDRLAKLSWRTFEEAREFARSLGLKSETEWRDFCRGNLVSTVGNRPADIPSNPQHNYAKSGWSGYGDWLGTGTVAPRLRKYLPFKEAREFARRLELGGGAEWRRFCKGLMPEKGVLPANISSNPVQTYMNKGWAGMGDWLGTGTIAPRLRKYRSFKAAREFARNLGLRSRVEWNKFSRGEMPEKGDLPADIPAYPNQTYAGKGWKGMGDWLGTGTVAHFLKEYRSFKSARAFARKLRLSSSSEWWQFCKGGMPKKGKLPSDIPVCPNNTYKYKGWSSWGDWLGTGVIAPSLKKYRSFKQARAFARILRLKNSAEWREYCRGKMPEKGSLPSDIPVCPNQTYKNAGWTGIGDWLGTETVANHLRKYRPFEEARSFARSLCLKGVADWRMFCGGKMPEKGGLPTDIPAAPDHVYSGKGWGGFGDWLGTGSVATFLRSYRSFEEARSFVHSLELKGEAHWRDYCRKRVLEKGSLPLDIPANPSKVYAKNGWTSWADWLGTARTRVSKSAKRKT
jgi:superfamily II DNA or RNA helicase